jgi:hypothetical protein
MPKEYTYKGETLLVYGERIFVEIGQLESDAPKQKKEKKTFTPPSHDEGEEAISGDTQHRFFTDEEKKNIAHLYSIVKEPIPQIAKKFKRSTVAIYQVIHRMKKSGEIAA